MEIYQPAEDSYLFQKILIKYLNNLMGNKKGESKPSNNQEKDIKILDMGSGSGIQALTCRNLGFKKILTADINPDAIEHLKKQKLNAIKSNLFSNIKEEFDIIFFNPPYLPKSKYDNKPDTTAGKKGYETIIRFLKQAKSHLKKNGKIILLFSTNSNPKIILKTGKKLGYNFSLLGKQRLFFEELSVYLLKNQ